MDPMGIYVVHIRFGILSFGLVWSVKVLWYTLVYDVISNSKVIQRITKTYENPQQGRYTLDLPPTQ